MNPNLTKSCTKCGEARTLDEFPRDRSKGSGRKSICKECDREKARGYYQANRETVLARMSARYEEKHKDVPAYLRRQRWKPSK